MFGFSKLFDKSMAFLSSEFEMFVSLSQYIVCNSTKISISNKQFPLNRMFSNLKEIQMIEFL